MDEIMNFIKYGVNSQITTKEFRKSIIALSIWNSFGIIFGVAYEKLIPLCLAILIIAIFSIVIVFIKSKRITLKNYFWNSGILSISCMIESMFCSLIFCDIGKFNTSIKMAVILLPILLLILFFLINLFLIRKKAFHYNKNVHHQKVKYYAACGGAFGLVFARVISTNISQSNAFLIVVICYTIISSAFALGGLNFYKIKLLKNMNYDEHL